MTLRGTGRFLDTGHVVQSLKGTGAQSVTRLRADGPAAVLTARKAETAVVPFALAA